MVQTAPWNVRGIDPDLREAALMAARRSGMTLGQWLNAVIGDTLTSFETEEAGEAGASAPSPAAVEDPMEAVARRIHALSERGSSMAMAAAGATRGGDDADRVSRIVADAVAAMERTAREREARTAAALEAMARMMEQQRETRPEQRRRWNDTSAAETPAAPDAADAAEFRAGNPVRTMIERIETRLDALSERQRQPDLSGSLRELDQRLSAIARKLDEPRPPAPEPRRDDNVQRIEGKLSAILDALNRQRLDDIRAAAAIPLARREEPVAEEGVSAIPVPARREELAPLPFAPIAPAAEVHAEPVRPRPPIPRRDLRNVLDDIARRQQDLDLLVSDEAPEQARAAADAPFDALKQQIEALSARLAGGTPADTQLQALRGEITALSRAIEDVAPRHVVSSIENAVRELAQRVEQSRDTGLRAKQLAPVENLLLDLRIAVESLRDSKAIDVLRGDLRDLSDRLASQAGQAGDGKALAALQEQVADLRRVVLRAQEPAALENLEKRISGLAETLHDMASAPRDAAMTAGLTSAVDAVRNNLQLALPTDLLARIEARIGDLGQIEARLGEIAARIENAPDRADFDALNARVERMHTTLAVASRPAQAAPELGAIEAMLRDLSGKIDAAQNGDDERSLTALESQIARLTARLDAPPAASALDTTISELFSQLETVKRSAVEAATASARDVARQNGESGALQAISRELADLRQSQGDADHRTQLTLTAVNDALGKIVARLGALESDPAPRMRAPETPAPALPLAMPEVPVPTKSAASAPARPAPTRPVEHDLSATGLDRATSIDTPIEPGTGRPGSSSARPAVSIDSNAPADSKASFIAAARRAAKAAEEQSASALQAHREASESGEGRLGGLKAAITARRKPIMLGIAAALVGIVALQALNAMRSQTSAPAPKTLAPAEGAQKPEAAPAPQKQKSSSLLPADPMPVGSIGGQAVSVPAEAPAAQLMPASPSQIAALKPLLGPISSERLRNAALSGDTAALHEIGVRFLDGRDAPRDVAAGVKFLETAANLGLAPAQYRLGSLYREGRGVKIDKAQALHWFRKAAENGNARAMHNVGVLMAEGVGGAPDYAAAADWFRKAAELNIRDSQYNLAILYARGLGVPQDLSASYRWFTAAADQGDNDAGKKRADIVARMPAAELATAKAAAAAWQPKPLDVAANEVKAPAGGWDAPLKASAAPHGKASAGKV